MSSRLATLALLASLGWPPMLMLAGCGGSGNLTEQEHIQRAQDFESKGEFRSGILELKNAIQKNPESAQARLLLGQIYIEAQDGNSAEKELRRARDLGVNGDMIAPLLGEALLLQEEFRKVLDEIAATDRMSSAHRAQVLRIRADALFGLRQYRDACATYESALELDSTHVPVYWGLANCAYGQRDLAQAKSLLEKAVETEPKNASSWIKLGDFHRRQDAYPEAEAAFTNAVQAAPRNAGAYVNRAGTRLVLRNEEGAKADFKKASEIAPKDPSVRYMQALFHYRAGKFEAAREELEALNRAAPNHFQANLLLGFVSYRLGNLQSAENHLARVLNIAPSASDVRLALASAQMRLGRPQQAMETLQPLLAGGRPANPEALALAGDIYMSLRNFHSAQAYYQRAVEIAPQSANIRTQLARSALAGGDADLAVAELLQAVRMDAKPSAADTLLIMTRLDQAKYDQSLTDIAALEKKQPTNPLASYLRGQAYLGKADRARAEAAFARALELDPLFAPAAVGLANLKVLDGKHAEAEKVLKRLLEHNPKSLEAMIGLADLARTANRPNEALDWLNKAIATDPDALGPRQHLVAHYLAAREHNKALVVANEAVARHPNNVLALRLLARVHIAQRNFVSAVATYSRITGLQPDSPTALFELANAQMGMRQFAAARESLRRAQALAPDSLEPKAALVSLDSAEGKLDSALKRAQALQISHPGETAGYILAGDLLMATSRYAEAVRNYEKAFAIAANGPVAISLYRALRAAGKGSQAISVLAQWVERSPADDISRLYLATAFRNAGRSQDALRHLNYLLSKNPKNALAFNELAITQQRLKDPRARESAERAYEISPVPAIADTLAMIYLESGDQRRALELLEEAVKSGTTNPEILYHHALALARNGQNAKAKEALRKLLAAGQAFPQESEARALLSTLR